jgi:hypothetical protein
MSVVKNRQTSFLWAFFALGLLLRVIFPNNFEWKFDQQWMFNSAMETVSSGKWQLLGMPSGGRVNNPALSVWVFNLIGFVAKTPLAMSIAVMVLNILTVIGFAFSFKKFSDDKDHLWLWAITLFSVSPLPVLFSRHIWAQNILLPFLLFVFLGHCLRKNFLGALCWGFFGGLIGQIHMSGFFFAFAIFITTALRELAVKKKVSHWPAWFLGSLLSLIPMAPWIHYMLTKPSDSGADYMFTLGNLVKFRFLTFNFMDVTGVHLKYSLGKHFYDFLKDGFYLNGLIYGLLCGLALFFAFKLAKALPKIKTIVVESFYSESPLVFYTFCSMFSFGLIFTGTLLKIRPHYLIILYPFSFYFFVLVLRNHKKVLFASVVLQFLLTLNFHFFIERTQDLSRGDYGKTYKLQVKEGTAHKKAAH